MSLFRVAKPKLNVRPLFSKTPFLGPHLIGQNFCPKTEQFRAELNKKRPLVNSRYVKAAYM